MKLNIIMLHGLCDGGDRYEGTEISNGIERSEELLPNDRGGRV